MAEFFEFGNRSSILSTDKLEHYRIEIRKLKELNYSLEQRYEQKIKMLQNQLKSSNKTGNNVGYQPVSKLNTEILKRDQEINRLHEENERLKKQSNHNPDKHLIAKKRELFEVVTQKDQQILRLKKTIHELESKYDGKYFNESKFKQDYQMLIKENKILKKQVLDKQAPKRPNEINSQILEGIRYKKQYGLVSRQNQHLKKQLSKLKKQLQSGRKSYHKNLGENTQNQLFDMEMQKNDNSNQNLNVDLRRLRQENKELKNQNVMLKRTRNYEIMNQNQPKKDPVTMQKKRKPISFDRQSAKSDEKKSNQISQKEEYYDGDMDPENSPDLKYPPTSRKTGLYEQFDLHSVKQSQKLN